MTNILLEAVVGSTAYGLNHENSDTDKLGIFVAPTTEVSGFDWHSSKETISDTSPVGDDFTLHEIGKFCRLALKSNPTVLELLFLSEYETVTDTGKELLSLRDNFLGRTAIRSAYYGYASSQLLRIQQSEKFKPKMARHTLRISRQAVELLATHEVTVKVPDAQEYWDLTERPYDDMIRFLEKEVGKILLVDSSVPLLANKPRVSEFIKDVRRTYLD